MNLNESRKNGPAAAASASAETVPPHLLDWFMTFKKLPKEQLTLPPPGAEV